VGGREQGLRAAFPGDGLRGPGGGERGGLLRERQRIDRLVLLSRRLAELGEAH